LFLLVSALLFGTELPTALHVLLTWGLSGVLLYAILNGTAETTIAQSEGCAESGASGWC
jgi:hypothetical protein